MKKLSIPAILLSLLLFSACEISVNSPSQDVSSTENPSVEVQDDVNTEEPERLLYTDTTNGVEMTFPASWENIYSAPLTDDSINIYAYDYPNKTLVLKMVNTNNGESLPTVEGQKSFFLGEKEGVYFYLLVDDLVGIIPEFTEKDLQELEADAESVIPTFKTL